MENSERREVVQDGQNGTIEVPEVITVLFCSSNERSDDSLDCHKVSQVMCVKSQDKIHSCIHITGMYILNIWTSSPS